MLRAPGPNYLMEEIQKRVADGPVHEAEKPKSLSSGARSTISLIAWPDSRKIVELGVVEIDKVNPDSDAAPAHLPPRERRACRQ